MFNLTGYANNTCDITSTTAFEKGLFKLFTSIRTIARKRKAQLLTFVI